MTTQLVSTGYPTSVLIFRFQVFPPTPQFPPPHTEKHHTKKTRQNPDGKQRGRHHYNYGAVLEIVQDVSWCSKEFLFPSLDIAELGPSTELQR